MKIERITLKTPNKGDVVWAIRLPCHCGIYEGDDSVIHFAPLNGSKMKEDAVIHRSTLAEFANCSPFLVIEFPPEKCLPPEETISRACSRLGEHTYDLFLNNCDHFATWCKIGEHRSLQVDLVKKIAVAACKAIDNASEKHTKFEKGAEIFCKIYKIVEILASPSNQK
ncbi:lecithin retinol acyltransferase family protein [Treponema sp. R6D11]